MLTIVGWLWKSESCRTQYTPQHVNIWASMIHRNLTIPHRFVVFTDDPTAKYDKKIEVLPLWDDHHLLGNESWRPEFPQCYVRLKAFSKDMLSILGSRFVSIDLDCVVTGNLDAILGRHEDFVIRLREPRDKENPYQASMWMMNTGCRSQVWDNFHGAESLAALAELDNAEHFLATDQGWILYVLGRDEAGWTSQDGVYSWKNIEKEGGELPEGAKIVFFEGKVKPDNLLWIGEHYFGSD